MAAIYLMQPGAATPGAHLDATRRAIFHGFCINP